MKGHGPIRLLAVSDWCDSGFGRVMKELLPRLAATGLFEIEMVAWVYDGDPEVFEKASAQGIRLHHCISDPWGKARTLPSICARFKPHIILTLGDPWMVEWVRDLPFRDSLRWVAYVPIDRCPISHSWLPVLSAPDALALYSDFGAEVVRRQLPFRHPQVISHGVDTETFHPLSGAEREGARASLLRLDSNAFVVGMVCRNQERKNVPAGFAAFKAFNCVCASDPSRRPDRRPIPPESYSCPGCGDFKQDPEKVDSHLYLHMTMGDGTDPDDGRGVSWNIHELAARYGLGSDRVHATRGLTVRKGVDSDHLNTIYNLFDVHLMTTKREGYGLPLVESMAAGIPNVVTGATSCAELAEKGGGELIDVLTYVMDPHEEAESAIADPLSAAEKLDLLFRDSGRRQRIARRGREFAESITWDSTIPHWLRVLHQVLGREVP